MTVRRDENRCSASEPWAVLDSSGKKLLGCHSTKEKANNQLRAIEANKGASMGILDKIKADDADIIKTLQGDFLEELNDDELRSEFLFVSGQFARVKENAESIAEALEDRGLERPDAEINSVLSKSKHPDKDKKDDEKDEKKTKKMVNVEEKQLNAYVNKSKGSVNAKVAFVGASPSKLDTIRKSPFTGNIGRILKDTYMDALGVKEEDVLLVNLVPEYLSDKSDNPREPTEEEIEKWKPAFDYFMSQYEPHFVVALGKTVASVIEYDEFVPHPRAIAIHGDSGEVERKLSRLKKKVTTVKYSSVSKTVKETSIEAEVIKTEDEKQIVVGVVYEPEELDADENWTSKEEIEKAAHFWMMNSQKMGVEHLFKTEGALPVESFIAPNDMTIGEKSVKEGAWVMSVKVLNDDLWSLVKSGEFTGFSIGALAKIDPEKKLIKE